MDNRAQLLPDWAICSAARIPAPPAPITTASNSRVGIVTLHTPQHDETRHQIDKQHHDQGKLQRPAQPYRLDIVSQHLPQTNPGVDQYAEQGQQGEYFGECFGEEACPHLVGDVVERDKAHQIEDITGHDEGGGADQDVIVNAAAPEGCRIGYHTSTPANTARIAVITKATRAL
ncbi:hypothetical protein AERO8C_200044 [Aeromonas veronii]|uniref:Uncharacterized protein n=1 Tax=Aeromonas veronii TaxID=654 RepID=A0A653L3Y7_AERVE|nr:hypothetical protein AERO8C_200044 [Aeromonas veronii]